MRTFKASAAFLACSATMFWGCSDAKQPDRTAQPVAPNAQSSNEITARMDPYLQQLFAHPDDFRLVDKIFVRITQQCDGSDEQSLSKLTPGQRVALDIWGSNGLIGNGGLSYLFSSDIVDMAGIGKSYDSIEVPRAAKAFHEALALFPDSKPPMDTKARVKHLASLGKAGDERLEELSKEIWACDAQITRNLAAFVRSHPGDFAGLPPSPWEDINEFKDVNLTPPAADLEPPCPRLQ